MTDKIILKPGDWIGMRYGFEECEWYVLKVAEDRVKLGRVEWCVSDAEWFSISRLEKREFFKIGSSKLKWWWTLLPWRNIICPFYYYS